jgi:hypothetical protein
MGIVKSCAKTSEISKISEDLATKTIHIKKRKILNLSYRLIYKSKEGDRNVL